MTSPLIFRLFCTRWIFTSGFFRWKKTADWNSIDLSLFSRSIGLHFGIPS
jgi:hypothetical protein